MTATIEAAKLVTAAWLTKHWRSSPWLLRWPLATMVMVLMVLTAIGTFGFLSRAHLQHQLEGTQVVDLGAAPLRQEAAMAEAAVRDLDGRIPQLDAMVDVATSRGRSKTAM